MSEKRPSYEELKRRLEQAEAALAALRRGEVDLVMGAKGPLLVRLKSLVEENERLARDWQATFDAANDAIWVIDSEHRILQSNRTAERFFGKPRQELIGRHCWEIVYGVTEPAPECSALRAKQSLRRESMKLLFGNRFFEATTDPILDEEGNYAGAIEIFSDITKRKQAEEEIRRRASELEAVHKVSTALRAAQSAEQALSILLNETLAALQADTGSILLYEPSRGELRPAAARGWFHELAEASTQPGEGIAGTVFSSGEKHISTEFASDPLTRASVRESVPPGWGGACVPIRAAASIIGVLFVSVRAPRQMTDEDVKVLESLAEMAGSALHRMRLHEETQRHVQQLQTLQTIDRAIISAVDSRLTLNILLEQALAPLGADAAGVLLFNPHTLTLEYAAGRGFYGRGYERSRLRLGEEQAGLAALERRIIHAADLVKCEPSFVRLPLLTDEGFVSYAVAPLIAKGQALGTLEVFHRASFEHSREWLNFFETIANQAAIAIDNARLFEGLQRSNLELSLAYDATIEGWARALELRDKETEGHTRRVTELTLKLARAAGMSAKELMHVRRGALLHDIGKMGIPDAILLKPDKLTEEEWNVMRQHPTLSYEMLLPIAYLRPALDIPYCHHEKWDGSGYPRGLKGEAIPLAARLFAVADVWDALRSDRPYRPAWTEDKTLEYIRSQAGKHFDPKAVELFFEVANGNASEQKTGAGG